MGVSCSRPSTASSSTPDRWPPLTTVPRLPLCIYGLILGDEDRMLRYVEPMYRTDTSLRYVPPRDVATPGVAGTPARRSPGSSQGPGRADRRWPGWQGHECVVVCWRWHP